MNWALVMVGGGLGALARYAMAQAWPFAARTDGVAWVTPTLVVNLVGGLLMGLLAGWLSARGAQGDAPARLFLAVGVLGGFTTFSAFSLEAVQMIERGAWGTFALYASVSTLGSIAALVAGLWLARQVLA